ncbi:hypothetical protein BV898_18175 [Hypsibius exemplaris]|uniref:Uncharacterized protein n=1 Tax=Hypsibius exemplaris TaxID=2072580 RepID=A0A9X6NJJ0_HYPEX|nr:hypothetical protein BV898_18175 [Hypsibius exemplaris]
MHINASEQVTRNNFPGRLRELLTTCQLKDTLKSGFSKTGIFPFKRDIIKATLPLVQPKPVQRVYIALNPHFNQIAETMTLLGVPKRARKFLMSSIRLSNKGESIGSEVATALSNVLASQKAPAKPRVPNRRGSFPHGSVITDQDFFASLVEKADNQKASKALTCKTSKPAAPKSSKTLTTSRPLTTSTMPRKPQTKLRD